MLVELNLFMYIQFFVQGRMSIFINNKLKQLKYNKQKLSTVIGTTRQIKINVFGNLRVETAKKLIVLNIVVCMYHSVGLFS